MAWRVRVTCNCSLPVSLVKLHVGAKERDFSVLEDQDSPTGFCNWEEGSQDGSQFKRCRIELGGCSEK